jgi:hypothetical protein
MSQLGDPIERPKGTGSIRIVRSKGKRIASEPEQNPVDPPVLDSGALEIFLDEYRALLSKKNSTTILNRTLCVLILVASSLATSIGSICFASLALALGSVWVLENMTLTQRISRIGQSIVRFHPKHDDLYILLTFPDYYANMYSMMLRMEALLWIALSAALIAVKTTSHPVVIDFGQIM